MAENLPAEMESTAESELTMCDVLEEEKELEEDARAVLGDSDDTNCTYDRGYVPRQALYACKTCTSVGEPGGICLACSYTCHEKHELVELYTKRNFRCDCGNKAFPNNACRLRPKKRDSNDDNKYNQNFQGVYCICSRPYPDADDDVQDQMIQCVMCEDWYHGRHLADDVPDSDDFGEMICGKCMDLNMFLYAYKSHFDMEKIIIVDNAVQDVKAEGIKNEASENGCKVEEAEAMTVDKKPAVLGSVKVENSCFLQDKTGDGLKRVLGPAFLPDGWRNALCRCNSCKNLYEEKDCLFLLDEHDTIKAYEERGKLRNGDESQYDKGLDALSKLDRVKQMEAIRGYNSMKTELKDYLKTFADAKRTVSAQDIQEFFDGMHQRKRQRVDNYVPHFCR